MYLLLSLCTVALGMLSIASGALRFEYCPGVGSVFLLVYGAIVVVVNAGWFLSWLDGWPRRPEPRIPAARVFRIKNFASK